ncbi:glycosyltransferase family 2 protein [Mucilaginibacter sp. AW1-7]|uniref:glycosyltransferase family 2 protein n=1 Tax=Mucilaginibacter sp. AW1-7 TaxID=3349874 RepID=UPI003F73F775
MPAYNAGDYILQSVGSVISQSYPNWELIIVNDGSTDQTASILEGISDKRIKVYHQQNQGQCAAANRAFRLSGGSLIKFMDADDLLSPDFLRAQAAVLNNEDFDIAYASWGRFYDGDLSTFKPETGSVRGDMQPFAWLMASMTGREVMLQCALWLIPRPLLDKAGLWNEQLSLINDFEFFIRVLLNSKKLKYAETAVLYYRSGLAGSLSSGNSAKAAISAFRSIDLGTGHLLRYSDTPEVKQIAADCFRRFTFTFYPDYPELINQAEQRIKALGGSELPFSAGGATRILAALIGWKAAKKIKKHLQQKPS